ncbi:MAG: SH3 domain-containing protein [Chloroflexota bacterium]
MKRIIQLAGLVSIALMACTRSSSESLPTPIPTINTQILPSATPVPPTPTSAQVRVRITSELVNCRFGPGTNYQLVTELRQGQTEQAVGRNEASTWWYVRDPGNPGGFCWVSADVTEAQGDASQLQVAQPPFVTITKVDLRVEPNRIVVSCNQFPKTVFFEAQITANGPTLLKWKWEVSTGIASNEGAMIYEEAGTQIINEYYQINAPGDYWVKLLILAPTEQVNQVTFPVTCTP